MKDKDFPIQLEEFSDALAQLDKSIAEMKTSPESFGSESKLLNLMDEIHILEKKVKAVEVKDD